jgi:asparagine synthase (glutamine-hydrolysing)
LQPLFEGMRKVMGGHMIVYDVEKETTLTKKYYQPYRYELSDMDMIDIVLESIRSVKVADVPVSLLLSGGIDSTVAASQCKYMNAVHLASPEERFARQVAEKYHNVFTLVEPREYKAEPCLDDYAKQSGDCSMAALIPYVTCQKISAISKVAISANGADELFFGYDRIKEAPTSGQYDHIFRRFFMGEKNGLSLYSSWGEHTDWQDARELELRTYVEFDLNKTLDFASMCHSVEMRVPFLNKSVIEAALSIPRGRHVNGMGAKSLLKKYLTDEGFDSNFTQRPKVGFSLHQQPKDYRDLQIKGMALLKKEFGISPVLHSGRDQRYYEASAASFYCWFSVWKEKLN